MTSHLGKALAQFFHESSAEPTPHGKSFEYRLFPVGPDILGGAIAWRAEDAKEVLDFYRAFTATTPRETTCVAVQRIAPPAPW